MRLRFISILSFAVFSITVNAYAQKSAPMDAQTQEKVRAIVKAHSGWRKLSSPGVSIRAKEIQRQGPVVKYQLFLSGLSSDDLYEIFSWPVTQQKPSTVIAGASLGKDGIVMCAGKTEEQCAGEPSKKDDPIDFVFYPSRGEPFRLALVSGDQRAGIVIVPIPISAKDKGCTLDVERLMPNFELAYFTGSGFPPDAEIAFQGESHGEKHEISGKTDTAGNLHFVILPFVAGHSKGTTTMKALRTGCSPTLKFDWGR